MSFAREVSRAVRSTLALWVITALIYPLVMVVFAQVVFPFQANGSILKNAQGVEVGSALIGQPFSGDRYFHSRPSVVNYSTADPKKDESEVLRTGISGASNLAPSNPALIERIQEQLKQPGAIPAGDLVYSSGSGLDPHITPASARLQIPRIAQARNIETNKLELLILNNTEGRALGIFGEPGVNVLKLNLDLDKLKVNRP
jgi:K+-transporting ATPase ATPase C chain